MSAPVALRWDQAYSPRRRPLKLADREMSAPSVSRDRNLRSFSRFAHGTVAVQIYSAAGPCPDAWYGRW